MGEETLAPSLPPATFRGSPPGQVGSSRVKLRDDCAAIFIHQRFNMGRKTYPYVPFLKIIHSLAHSTNIY